MTVVNQTFRQQFREFKDPLVYPSDAIDLNISVATQMVNATRWGTLADYGVSLLTAHLLVIGARETQRVAAGGTPGQFTGPMTAKAVDKVSASYDTSAITEGTEGWLAMTSYGITYSGLAKRMGAGPIQIGVGAFSDFNGFMGFDFPFGQFPN